jgi:hypothetical protein
VSHHPVGDDPLSVIMKTLTRKHNGNLHDLGIVTVTVSSDLPDADARMIRKRILDLICDQWICCDFWTSWICPTDYIIRAEAGPFHLQNWVTEGPERIQRDERRDKCDLKECLRRVKFLITHPQAVRQIQIRQTGLNHNGNHCFALSAFELFGDLDESSLLREISRFDSHFRDLSSCSFLF